MKITVLPNEYPPFVYGGTGVHVDYLSRELAHRPWKEEQLGSAYKVST